jgi:hypothetical protein
MIKNRRTKTTINQKAKISTIKKENDFYKETTFFFFQKINFLTYIF